MPSPQTLQISLASCFIASAAALRLMKHLVAGPIQFINVLAIFTILGGACLGLKGGFVVGLLSFPVSDFMLGLAGLGLPGWWTLVTSLSMAFIGVLSSFLWFRRGRFSALEVFICSYLLIFVNDLLSSFLFYIPFMEPSMALASAFIGLFLPMMGGHLYAVGPVTEALSSFSITLLLPLVRKALRDVVNYGG